MVRSSLVVLLCVLVAAAASHGAYTLAPMAADADSTDVYVNTEDRTITLGLVLASDASPVDVHGSAVFTIEFSKPGLQYDSYSWAGAYVTEGLDDHSAPSNPATPVVLSAASYASPVGDGGSVDIYFENLTDAGEDVFETGVIATITLTVPEDFPLGPVVITAVPDTFDDGQGSIATVGEALTLNVKLRGDINNDGLVGGADLDIVLGNWGKTVPPGDERADVNSDGLVNGADLDIILGYWGDDAPPPSAAALALPGSVKLAVLGFAAPVLWTRRRRAAKA